LALEVFISYAREDREQALLYYDRFMAEGVKPWIDVKHLLPGQSWEAEIDRALADANVVVLLLSRSSVNKRGFVQREANEAISRLRYKQPTDIYVVPLLLDQCEVPSYISGRLQYVDLNAAGAWDQVRASLRIASEQQSIQLAQGVPAGPFQVFSERIEETWVGLPGHDVEIEFPRFELATRPALVKELNAFFLGLAYKTLIASRQKPWEQDPELFKDRHPGIASNGRWDGFEVVHATEGFLSVARNVGTNGAGAAHPNTQFKTYNFVFIADKLHELSLHDFFTHPGVAADRISRLCIQNLCREWWERTGEKPNEDQAMRFEDGAGPDLQNFSAFTVGDDHFTFLFPPYQVAAYALGSWSSEISFYDLLDLLRPDGPHLQAAARPRVR
jgi:hypothetical protein